MDSAVANPPENASPSPEQVDLLIRLLREALYAPPSASPDSESSRVKVLCRQDEATGNYQVLVQSPEATFELVVPHPSVLVNLAGPRTLPLRPLDALALPYAPRTAPALAVEQLEVTDGQGVSRVLAGESAQSVSAIASARGRYLSGAAYACRGPTIEAQGMEYKPINEDAVTLRLWRSDSGTGAREILGIGAFDQAGGEGSVEGAVGAASEVAARVFEETVKRIEAGADVEASLREAVTQASAGVRSFEAGALTTFAAAVVVAEAGPTGLSVRAHVVTVGDSRVLLFSRDGKLKEATLLHNMGALASSGGAPGVPPAHALRLANVVFRCVGGDSDTPDLYTWELQPGDRLVVQTDGVGDAHEFEEQPDGRWHAERCAEAQAHVSGAIEHPVEAVRTLVGYALDQMADRYGKPDNIALGVVDFLVPTEGSSDAPPSDAEPV